MRMQCECGLLLYSAKNGKEGNQQDFICRHRRAPVPHLIATKGIHTGHRSRSADNE